AAGINYNGTSLTENNDFTRTECGTSYKDVLKEVSGLACSRQTPGFLWAHGDENTGDNRKIVAIQPSGTLAMTVKLTTPNTNRDDWEDICTGVYDNTNYVFVGAIGDNDLQFNDQYYIYYFEEPAITSGTITVTVNTIRYGYPDNQAHNTETLMYDNVEQMFYIADKVDGVCHLYQLPFRTDYGSDIQRLTEVCALGNGGKFKLANGGDISPDGRCMAIKSEKHVLLWERQGSESLSVTAQRLPVQVMAYEKEEQGESLAWFNDSIFYTTSDSKNDTPIYKYVRGNNSSTPDPTPDPEPEPEQVPGVVINEIFMTNHYQAYMTDSVTVHAYYLAGKAEPAVDSCTLNVGTTWEQSGNTLTFVGADSTQRICTLDIQPVQPVAFTSTEIVFDGTETWVKGAYGFDATKKWRIAKTDDDYSREMAGKTHLEMFLPSCDTVEITSSITNNDRAIRVYANGVQIGDKVTLKKNGTLTFAVNQSAAFVFTLASAQSSGDAGIKSVRMARKPGNTTDLGEVQSDNVPCTKVLRNGQLFIVRGEKEFTVTGQLVR
ncbi:MAG: hypothetical protein II644_05750, partial [Paludibacteraceae bacterium]|nr:hypothetical protein [Paludibacteraceae bacterium]